jgi:hypothetical protein
MESKNISKFVRTKPFVRSLRADDRVLIYFDIIDLLWKEILLLMFVRPVTRT